MSNSSPILSPQISSSPMAKPVDPPVETMVRNLSSSSVHSLANILASSSSSSSSSSSLQADLEVFTEDGLPHALIRLSARHYKSQSFAADLLRAVRMFHISSWMYPSINAQDVKISKVSGSLTNAVFFVSAVGARTLLLRIYGPSSGSLISRPRELHTLHILSSKYRIGPRIYGTFENGRIEEYFESTTLTGADLRDPKTSTWIGARMAELHSVDIEAVEETSTATRGEGKGWEIAAKRNVRSWLVPAVQVLDLPQVPQSVRDELNLEAFRTEWNSYLAWLSHVDDVHNGSRRVFCHNDSQMANLLRVKTPKEGLPEHHQIIVVDFEYAAPNPASYDIANHFHEWTANYQGPTPHLLEADRYPTIEERYNFYRAYLKHVPYSTHAVHLTPEQEELRLRKLDEQVRVWSPASHAMWAIWGIVQARDDLESGNHEPEFNYISYALGRMAGFRREFSALGVF